MFLKRLESPPVERKYTYTRTPEGVRTTPQHRQERRDRGREQTSENKENIAAHGKDVDIFVLPPPRTPVSGKKNARPNKNVLTTPNQNGTDTNAVSPKSKISLLFIQSVAIMQCRKCRVWVCRTVYLSTVIDFFFFPPKQGLWSTGIFIWLFALANCPLSTQPSLIICPSLSTAQPS